MFATLTDEQKHTLADLVTEHTGVQQNFATFCDYLLLLFEEVPGFETIEPSRRLLREIWRIHRARSEVVSNDSSEVTIGRIRS